MTKWPKNDGNFILYFEMILMTLFLVMNATDLHFQDMNSGNIISQYIAPLFSGLSKGTIHFVPFFYAIQLLRKQTISLVCPTLFFRE